MYIISATAKLSNNQIFSNTATHGGGMFVGESAAQVDHNTILAARAEAVTQRLRLPPRTTMVHLESRLRVGFLSSVLRGAFDLDLDEYILTCVTV